MLRSNSKSVPSNAISIGSSVFAQLSRERGNCVNASGSGNEAVAPGCACGAQVGPPVGPLSAITPVVSKVPVARCGVGIYRWLPVTLSATSEDECLGRSIDRLRKTST